MTYLTSSGLTTSIVTYIKDILDLNFHVEYGRIPYLDLGCNSLIDDMRLKESKIIIDSKVQEVIQRVNSRNGVTIEVNSIELIGDSNIQLNLSVGNLKLLQLL